MRLISVFLLVSLAFSVRTMGDVLLGDFDAVLPHVGRGGEGTVIETTVYITNPNAEAVVAELSSTDETLLAPSDLTLAPLETKTVALRGEELRVGSIRVHAAKPLSVHAFVLSKQEDASSLVTLTAEPLAATAVIPVLYRSAEVDNTGLAIFFRESGQYRLTLYDSSGTELGRKTIIRDAPSSPKHLAQFVDELFDTQLPPAFQGWIRVRAYDWQARGFSVTALYTKGSRLCTAQTSVLDDPAVYVLTTSPGPEGDVNELEKQYGFTLLRASPGGWVIRCPDSVAQALERDPRVDRVEASWDPLNVSD